MIAFPIIAMLIGAACAALVARDAMRRPKPDRIAWTIAFLLFAIAAGSEVLGAVAGWSPALVRVYYLSGAVLVVGYLALGELYLLAPRRIARFGPGAALLVTALAATLVLDAPIDLERMATEGWQALERGPALIVATVTINALGTVVLVGGALWSAWRFWRNGIFRHRMIGCVLIALGTLAVAMGGTLTRFGQREYLYIAMAIGIVLIFWGYLETRRPDTAAASAIPAAPAPPIGERGSVVALPPARPTRADFELTDPGAALIASWLGSRSAAEIGELCREWSVPAGPADALNREDARRVWRLRLLLDPEARQALDALPVPVRRQLGELRAEVLLPEPIDEADRVAVG
ncbi:MAG: hypothetical protein IT337_03645 [Thermomicrobiales bacterium]|nr:hypothetical protein [Thermomicrobiales bacterium]